MRRYTTKEVTFTRFDVAKIVVDNGTPFVEQLPEEVLIGNITEERALKIMKEKYGEGIKIYNIETYKRKFKMSIYDFIMNATEVTDYDVDSTDESEK